MEQSAHTTGHFAVFAYSLLFDQSPIVRTASANPANLSAQQQRQREIVPFLHWLREYTRNKGR
jgi:hypothetical protein